MNDPLSDYSTMLLYYNNLALTNQGDVLHAMAGIMRRLSEECKYSFPQGLPTAALDARLDFTAHSTILHRRNRFPSYSWTGWLGNIDIDVPFSDDIDDWLPTETWIVWYKRSPSGVVNFVWDPAASDSVSIRGAS